jgi:hypothetical protein
MQPEGEPVSRYHYARMELILRFRNIVRFPWDSAHGLHSKHSTLVDRLAFIDHDSE